MGYLRWRGSARRTAPPELPRVEVHLLNRPDEKPLGSGEASTAPTAAAIANAVGNAIGGRVRDLPLDPERVKAAILAAGG